MKKIVSHGVKSPEKKGRGREFLYSNLERESHSDLEDETDFMESMRKEEEKKKKRRLQ